MALTDRRRSLTVDSMRGRARRRVSRRTCLGGLVGAAALVATRSAYAQQPPPIPTLPIRLTVARLAANKADPKPVVDAAWLEEQVDVANRIFGPHHLSFQVVQRATLDSLQKLETRADRDALATHLAPTVVNVFVVKSLRDVDDPSLYRMGVHWRKLSNLNQRYVIVAASARPATMAHELGHYLGNAHSGVLNNLMSYRREDGADIFLDQSQGVRARQIARGCFARGELKPAASFPPIEPT